MIAQKGRAKKDVKELFMDGSPTPRFNVIKNDDYAAAIERGIEEGNDEIYAIACNTSRPTFANTIDKLDSAGELLRRVTDVFYNQLIATADSEKERLAETFAPALAAHSNDIMLNHGLFMRVKYVYRNQRMALTPEKRRLTEKLYREFIRHGALLKARERDIFRRLTEEAARLSVQFQTNLLHARKKYVLNITDPGKLEGVPDTVCAAMAAAALENGEKSWAATLDEPVYRPMMTYCRDRDLRRELYIARNGLCLREGADCNVGVCRDILNVRMEIAKLLGYNTYADYALEERMAENTGNVYQLLDDLKRHYYDKAKKEVSAAEEYARQEEGEGFSLQPWDFAYYSQKLRQSLYGIDDETLRPYFELQRVKNGIFRLAFKLYGIKFRINRRMPAYASKVSAYDVYDADGRRLGALYLDLHPRKGKQSGAWMSTYSRQYIHGEENHRPCVAIVANFTPSASERPSLLTLGEVTTFLHEFGHALHALMSDTTYRLLSGTNVLWDFVELPSQIMENFATEKDFLKTFAVHYQTGEPMPKELIDKIVCSRNFNVACDTMRQVELGLLDMACHTIDKPFEGDIEELERQATAYVRILPAVENTCTAVQFAHIMSGGYAAGYYSYKWAELLEADAFSEFQEHGVFSSETAGRFRQCILSKGDTEPPMELYRRFRGKEPSIDAMLRRDGIKDGAANNEPAAGVEETAQQD